MSERLLSYCKDQHHTWWDEYVTFCRQPSIAATGEGMEAIVPLLQGMLEKRGFRCEVWPTDGYPIVYAELPGTGSKTLLMYNHYDVQPPEPVDAWRHPPFAGVVEDGIFYCRGCSDHKGSLVSRIQAVEALQATTGELPCTVKFIIEGEEEIGSPSLASTMQAHRRALAADAALYSGAMKTETGLPTVAAGGKGILYVTLRARGANREVHSRMATLVPNPAWRLQEALSTMRSDGKIAIDGFFDHVIEPGPEDLAAAAQIQPGFPFAPGANVKKDLGIEAFVGDIGDHQVVAQHLFSPTLNICGLRSGYIGQGTQNVVPADAEVKLDILLVPDQSAADIAAKIRRHLSDRGFHDIEVEIGPGLDPARTPLTEPIVQATVDATREAHGTEPVLSPLFPSFGPWALLIRELGLPTVADTGVSHAGSAHHEPNENIRVADYLPGTINMALLIRNFGSYT